MNAGSFIARRLGDKGNRISWISVALSIAVMVVAIAVVDGFKSEIRAKATGFMGSAALVPPGQSPLNEGYPFTDSISYASALDSLRCVESVSAVAYRSGLIKTPEAIAGVYFKGVDSLFDFSFFKSCLTDGEIPDFRGGVSNKVLISRRLADQLGLSVGDRMTAYFIGDDIKVRRFDLCGLFDAQLDDIDKSFAVIDIRQVRRLNGWSSAGTSSIEIRIPPRAGIDASVAAVDDLVSDRMTDHDPSLFTLSVKRIYAHLFDWLALLDLNVVMILALMMAVAGFNMISCLLIILFRNISTIGILKSMGMTNRAVSGVFLRKAAALVGKGMLVGNALALALCLIQKYTHIIKLDPANYFVSYVPIDFNWLQIIAINAISFVVIMLILSLTSIFVSRVSPAVTMKVD